MASKGNDKRIDYVEFNVTDIAASKAFYGSAFGWTFTDYGPEYCEFADGRLTGGFTTLGPVRSGGPLVIIYADQIEDAQRRVEAAGGKIVKPIFTFPAAGGSILPTPMAMSWRCGPRSSRTPVHSPKRMNSAPTSPKTTMHCRMNMGHSCDISFPPFGGRCHDSLRACPAHSRQSLNRHRFEETAVYEGKRCASGDRLKETA